ncbi:MAG: hypothetical protein SNJ80_09230 [Anaerolinea sp.]
MSLETLISFTLTLLIFSYLLRDNVLYRLVIYAYIGITSAFVVITLLENVIATYLSSPRDSVLLLVAFVLVTLLALRAVPGLRAIGLLPLAFLIAVGAAVAVTGAIAGTILPLATRVIVPGADVINSAVLFIGVITTLLYFQYGARRRADGTAQRTLLVRGVGAMGEAFIVVMMGATYGAIIISSLSVFTGQLSSLLGR